MTAKQLDRLLSILDRAVKVSERWADREYPQIDESQEATISRVGVDPSVYDSEDRQKREVEEAVGRFETRYRAQS